eukprot:CAMPEP_0119024210 /NCGR_PEP_ID=MMETSP1176-20130426/31453_1 /TAXON_ID=265551 /ORGANISM="Synedropsis recta cf, Strain CCMP1620" /LENGTH=111 /DNA_ID=CAMNT_0006979445 /DNA_START=217 /DNA_END=552 /DNA_ORIENTATION=-
MMDDYGEEEPTLAELSSVAVASGFVTTIVLGPLVGVGVAVTAACVAISNTKAGQVTRQAGSKIVGTKDQITEYERKHQVVERSRMGVIHGCEFMAKKLRSCSGSKDDIVLI